jgi:hypothetical protein
VAVDTSNTTVESQATLAPAMVTVRRSKRSAIAPPYSPARIIGTSEYQATSDTAKVDCVRA